MLPTSFWAAEIPTSYARTDEHTCVQQINCTKIKACRSRWPRGLRRRSAAGRLLRVWLRIPPRAWTSVCCDCCVLSGRSLRDELITRPEESYRLWCVVWDLETTWMRRLWPTWGCRAKNKQKLRHKLEMQSAVIRFSWCFRGKLKFTRWCFPKIGLSWVLNYKTGTSLL